MADTAPGVGSHSATRAANERRIIDALRLEGPSSQAHLARRTGLARGTVNSIVKSLHSAGSVLVREVNGRESSISLVTTSGAVLAMDIGPASVRAAAISLQTQKRTDMTRDVRHLPAGPPRIDVVAELVDELLATSELAREQITGTSVAVRAPLDSRSETILPFTAMTGWQGLPLRAMLEERLGLEVTVDKDTNFAALAEWTWGVGRGTRDFLYVNWSTTLAASLILDSKVHRGATGLTAELGHIGLDEGGAVCACGNRGCLTTYVSGRFLLLQLQTAGEPRNGLFDVIKEARSGDPACIRVLADAGRHLGHVLGDVSKIVAPSVIGVGGELTAAGPLVFDSLTSSLAANSLRSSIPGTVARIATIRRDQSILGGIAHSLANQGTGLSELPEWLRRK